MLAYAANRPVAVDRRPYPNAMLLIIGAHVAALAVVMSAKMDLPLRHKEPPTIVDSIKLPPQPPPPPTGAKTTSHTQTDTWIDNTETRVVTPPMSTGDLGGKLDPKSLGNGGSIIIPEFRLPEFPPVKSGPQLLTPPSELKPPYPASKLDNGEEAVLTVKLTIDANGRVTAVDPVGRTDPVFLDAARRYVIAHWHYKPAIEDGRAVVSTAVVTLHFELSA